MEELQVPYDSTADTLRHIERVRDLMGEAIGKLRMRAIDHDKSKLAPPEKPLFDEYTPKLKGVTYGSPEYAKMLEGLAPALEHHYAANSHHPEHFPYDECGGCFKRFPAGRTAPCDICGYGFTQRRADVTRMSLLDLLEMLCDWKAAGERHADGSMARSFAVNKERFDIPAALQSVLENTAREMGWLPDSR